MEPDTPKQRILETAIDLFARKGYAGTGVRELARAADVNTAMINYYYGSKLEILKLIIMKFFTRYIEIAESTLTGKESPDTRVRLFIKAVMSYFKDNPGLMIIGLTEFPMEVPELAKIKAEYVTRVKGIFITNIFRDLGMPEEMNNIAPIIGPSLIGMMAAQFIFRPVIEKLDVAVIDDAYYDRAGDLISELFLHGIKDLAASCATGDSR